MLIRQFVATLSAAALLGCLPNQAAWAAGCPANLVPMYKGVEKNAAMIAADDKFRAAIAEQGYTGEEGAQIGIDLGWRYFFNNNDPETAMKRFNQAWMIDPHNGGSYHGMAVMSLVLSEDPAYGDCPFTPDRTDTLFQKALTDKEVTPGAYADYGRFLVMQDRFTDALPILDEALKRNPDEGQAVFHKALAHYGLGDRAKACPLAKEARAMLPYLPQEFVTDLCSP